MATLRERIGVAARALVGLFSDASLRQAHGMLAGIYPGATGSLPLRGTRERLAAFATMPWLHAPADKVAQGFAATEWQLFIARRAGERARRVQAVQKAMWTGETRPGDRKALLAALQQAGELEQITEHPMLDTLTRANPFHTGVDLRRLMMLHYDIAGDVFLLKERDGLGTIIGLWPLPPHWISRTPSPAVRSYRVAFRGWHGEIPDTEILWISNPDPEFPYGRGVGLAGVLADELETDEYSCHDAETECLTRRGWIRGPELCVDDEVATWNEVLGVIEYHRPFEITKTNYDGPMHYWSGQNVNALVTPNHRLWIESRIYRRPRRPFPVWHFEESRDAMKKAGRSFRWRDAGRYEGTKKIVEISAVDRITKRRPGSRGGGRPPARGIHDPLVFDAVSFASFLGFYVSEGSPSGAGVYLAQTEGPHVNPIRAALGIFPPEWVKERTERTASGRTGYRWSVHHLGLAQWLRTNVGEGAANKRLPAEVFEWPAEAQEALMRALVAGDGHYSGRLRRSFNYATRSEGLADDVHRLCVQRGWSSRKISRMIADRPFFYIKVKPHLAARSIYKLDGTWVSEMPYRGLVWCVTVPNEKFFSRRRGCVMLGGNSKYLRQVFFNQAKPDFLIWPKGEGITAASRDRLQENWLAEHQGFWRVAKPMFLTREIGVHEFGQGTFNFRGMQLTQLREQMRDFTRQCWGVPPEIMGIIEPGASRATIDTAGYIFARWVLIPRLEAFRANFQERLAPEYDERLIVDYASPIEEDAERHLQAATAAPWAITVDEWRALSGHAPKDGGRGQVHMIPFALSPSRLGAGADGEPELEGLAEFRRAMLG